MYTFHQDLDNFKLFIETIGERIGINAAIVEKDYYVTLILLELSELQKQENPFEVYFKGGTALYKALNKINRFSEDVDLTLKVSESTPSSLKRNLKKVTSNFTSISIDKDAKERVSGSGSRTSVYKYQSVLDVTHLARIGEVKVETTSFTTSEPHSVCMIEPIILKYANEEEKNILFENYNIQSFAIEVITLQRIFVDKLFAIEDYYASERKNYIEIGKHLYDVCILMGEEIIHQLLGDDEKLSYIINQKETEQKRRLEAKTIGKSLTSFSYWSKLNEDQLLQKGFEDMQEGYIYQEEYKFLYTDSVKMMKKLYDVLYQKNY